MYSVLLAAAVKSGAERIYTTNVRHFQSLADDQTRAHFRPVSRAVL